MGNTQIKNPQDNTSQFIEELCNLTLYSYNEGYILSFDPFGLSSTSQKSPLFKDIEISSLMDQNEDTQSIQTIQDIRERQENTSAKQVQMGSQIQKKLSLQKNQNFSKKVNKTRQIKKENKEKVNRKEKKDKRVQANQNLGGILGVEMGNEQGIRDQNNCKSYHKLVKNYLIQNHLQLKIKEYEEKYHTRYYFIIALILIKHYSTPDFYPIYQRLVQAQVQIQANKITKKQREINTLNEKVQQLKNKGQDIEKLLQKKAKIQKQIEHIKVVIFEIEDYSVKSCRAYFNNEIEESLRILYTKNDPVMRKKYYFETGIEIINNLQTQVRKQTSHS